MTWKFSKTKYILRTKQRRDRRKSIASILFYIYIVSNPKKILSLRESPCVSIIRPTDKKSLKCKSLDIKSIRAYICALFASQGYFHNPELPLKSTFPSGFVANLYFLQYFQYVVLFLIKKSLCKKTLVTLKSFYFSYKDTN